MYLAYSSFKIFYFPHFSFSSFISSFIISGVPPPDTLYPMDQDEVSVQAEQPEHQEEEATWRIDQPQEDATTPVREKDDQHQDEHIDESFYGLVP